MYNNHVPIRCLIQGGLQGTANATVVQAVMLLAVALGIVIKV